MAAPIYNITINQNATWEMYLQSTDVTGSALDMTGWTFEGGVKLTYADITRSANFNIDVISYDSGTIYSYLTPSQSAALNANTIYVYDILAFNPLSFPVPKMYRLVQGRAVVSPGVTPDFGTD